MCSFVITNGGGRSLFRGRPALQADEQSFTLSPSQWFPHRSFTGTCHLTLSQKIKGVCRIAREAGDKLVWMDLSALSFRR
ncbi:hypothetical protein BC628DRAFT_1396265 [Trametes gibbosa]|nr:hypothetical protein BC628DRAFT_1396265 [Trametes gibbosa]